MKNALSVFSPSFEDDLLQSIGNGLGFFSGKAPAVPSVDIKQSDEAYILDMELPGMDEKDVDVSLHDHTLTISSKCDKSKEEKNEKNGVQYLVRERRCASFSRRFGLPEDSDFDKINASFMKGILQVTIPRKPDTKPRSISISSN